MIVENRKAGRELAFHIIYHTDRIGSLTPEEVERYWRLHPADERSKMFADRLMVHSCSGEKPAD